MSYNIDNIDVVHRKGFCITVAKLGQLDHETGDRAEGSIFDMLTDSPRDGYFEVVEVGGWKFIYPHTWWYGGWSGNSLDVMIELLSQFEGEADLVLTWEGGDSHTGLRLRNHVVTKHEVVLTLGEETS